MKPSCTWLIAIACLTLFFSCKKEADFKVPAAANAVLAQNKAEIRNVLENTDLSARIPGAWWWKDEIAAKQIGGITVPTDPRNYLSFKFLSAALAYTGLDAVLADPSFQYTVFAPNDQAFMNAGFATINDLLAVDKDALTQILLYHVVSGKVYAADVPVARNTGVPSVQGASLFLTRIQNPPIYRKAAVNGTGVYITDVEMGSNGVMHDINKVLMPPVGNIVQTAVANPDLSYLVAAVLRASTGKTDVAAVLSGDGPFTVFAPTNQAFMNAGFATVDDINNADPDVLASILTYHVVAARVFSNDVKDGDMPVMLNGGTTTINRTGELLMRKLSIKGASNNSAAMVGDRNIVATNGVVHVIDQVLLP